MRISQKISLSAATVVLTMLAGATPALALTPCLPPEGGPDPCIGSFSAGENPNGIAVDESTGDVYVAQIGTSEQQTVSIQGGPEGGGVTLEFKGKKTPALGVTGTVAPTAEAVQTALRELSTIGPANNSNVTVTEEGALPGTVTYTVSFQGELATASLPQLLCDGSALTGGTTPSCTVATTVPGVDSKVSKFDANGEPIESWGTKGTLDGSTTKTGPFSFPSAPGNPAAIAVDNSTSPSDPSAGDLYVLDAGHNVIDKFSPGGLYLSQITSRFPGELLGLVVDASGQIRVSGAVVGIGMLIDVFDNSAANSFVTEIRESAEGRVGMDPERGLAVGPGGDLYGRFQCGCTEKFGPGGEPLGRADVGPDVADAVDPATGHLFVDEQSSVSEWDTGEMNGQAIEKVGGFQEETASGHLVSRFGSLQLSSTSGQGGIAVNGASGDVYVSNPADGKVYVFAGATPAVAAGAATNLSQTGAELHGTVDPRGLPITSCAFEYEAAGSDLRVPVADYGHSVACDQTPAQIGSGTTPVAVSADVSGLQPGLLYHLRLVAPNANGSSPSSGLFATAGPGFGIKQFDVSFVNQDGTADTQAGSHPYEMVTNIAFNTKVLKREPTVDSRYTLQPDGGASRDVIVDLPPGLIGDPNATAKKCTLKELDTPTLTTNGNNGGSCPAEAAIGELEVEFGDSAGLGHLPTFAPIREPVYSMVPPHGVAVQIGAHFIVPNVFIDVGVKAGGDYPVHATALDLPTILPVVATRLTIFGVVGSGEHPEEEKRRKAEEANGLQPPPLNPKAFLTLPTGCTGPLKSSVAADSYSSPGHFAEASALTRDLAGNALGLSGCSQLKFPPTITVAPDTTSASTSSGLTVGVHVSQKAALNPDGLAESSLRNTTVTLPEGVALNPAGADGLQACSEGLAGFTGFTEFNSEFEPGVKTATFTPEMPEPLQPGSNFCPDGSKIGTVQIKTPLLPNPLEGAVYLAAQNANPFGSLVAMYLIAEDPVSGTIIKLTGEVSLSETGQIVTTFKNTLDLPFEDLELHFFGGERAPLTTPSRCGTYTTNASFVPWDGNGPVETSSSFQITSGPNGSPCPGASLPFAPSLTAGTTSNQAGGFSPFTMTMSREDGNQNLQAISLKMPPGLSGLLSGVGLCPEPQADQGTCGPGSLIGETIVSVGVGGKPFSVKGGRVYITGPYGGAPFGLSIVNPAKAGPYDLEAGTPCDCVVVRAKIEVDPHTAALTITSDNSGPYKIPTILKGIPLEIQHVNVTINRPGFTFNPTNCNPMSITGSLSSTEGATSALSVPLQATNCAVLGFKPAFKVSTSGKTSRSKGASLSVKLTYPKAPFGSQANIKSVKVDLPKQLPSRLTTLQKACTAAQFNTNPAGCPAASVIGHAKAITPLIPVPLEGPAYFVSHGGEAFPSLIVVLQGYGVTLDLVGTTFISKAGITSSTFKTVPDAPVGSFELTLPQGKFSALAANGNLCTSKLAMPTAFVAQNGAEIHESTPIGVSGCKPAITVTSHKVKGKTATIKVSVPSAGTLVATGSAIKRSTKRVAKAGTVTIGVGLSSHDLRVLAKNPHQRVNVEVKLRFTSKHGTPLTAYVRLLMG